MRVLTVKQPWAHAIIHGGKTVENRSRNLAGAYRGPVAIHAGLQRDDLGWVVSGAYALTRTMGRGHPEALGAIIGVVDLVDVHKGLAPTDDRMTSVDSCYRAGQPFGACSPWAEPDAWHLELANPRALDQPVPWRGALGLVGVPLGVEGEWLVEYVEACTCGVGGLSYGHEAGCGVEPLARLEATR